MEGDVIKKVRLSTLILGKFFEALALGHYPVKHLQYGMLVE